MSRPPVIHRVFDPERNWKARIESEAARRSLENQRHARNADVVALWTNALLCVLYGAAFVGTIRAAYLAGIFDWLLN